MIEGRTLSRRRLLAFAALATLIALEGGARVLPAAWYEAGLFKEHWLDARIGRAIARDRTGGSPAPTTGPQGLLSGLKPGLEGVSGLANEHRYNQYGYRGPDWPPQTSPGTTRVAVLGDSRIFGLYVGVDETLSARIGAYEGVEGLNFGVTGAGTFEALDYIVDDAIASQPTVAVLLYDINPSVLTLVPAARWSRRGSIAQVLRGSALLRRTEIAARHLLAGADGRVLSVPLSDYEVQVGQLIQRLRDSGVSQVVVLVGDTALEDQPMLFSRARYDDYRARTRAVGEAHDAAVVDVADVLRGMDLDDAYRGIGIHWSPQALERIASAVLQVVELRQRAPVTTPEPATPESTPSRPSPDVGSPSLR